MPAETMALWTSLDSIAEIIDRIGDRHGPDKPADGEDRVPLSEWLPFLDRFAGLFELIVGQIDERPDGIPHAELVRLCVAMDRTGTALVSLEAALESALERSRNETP
jgi:hypothetical protein